MAVTSGLCSGELNVRTWHPAAFYHFLDLDSGPSWLVTLKHSGYVVRLFSRVSGLLHLISVTY